MTLRTDVLIAGLVTGIVGLLVIPPLAAVLLSGAGAALAPLRQWNVVLNTLGFGAATTLCAMAIGGTLAFVIGVIGIASGYFYAGGPQPYVKHGLADPIFLAMFGVVAVAGTYYIQWAAMHSAASHGLDALQQLPRDVFLVGLPIGALVTNVMLVDDIRDRHFDAVKGWHTFAVRFGLRGIRGEFLALTALAYLLPLVYWSWLGFSAWIFLPLLTLPLAYKVARAVCRFDQTRDLLRMSPMASYLSLAYAALLALGIAL